jgi:hypothetical protein
VGKQLLKKKSRAQRVIDMDRKIECGQQLRKGFSRMACERVVINQRALSNPPALWPPSQAKL